MICGERASVTDSKQAKDSQDTEGTNAQLHTNEGKHYIRGLLLHFGVLLSRGTFTFHKQPTCTAAYLLMQFRLSTCSKVQLAEPHLSNL